MARPTKHTVEYFPHTTHHGETLFIIESKFGNDGYAFWFKLLEILGQKEGHVIDTGSPTTWEFLLAKTRVSGETASEILQTLANLHAIDPDLWGDGIIWCQKFVDGVKDAYRKRQDKLPSKPGKKGFPAEETQFPAEETPENGVSGGINGERESKGKEKGKRKVLKPLSGKPDITPEVIDHLNQVLGTNYRPTSRKTKALIQARQQEGFDLEAFKAVINKKAAEWQSDPKMHKYLRPETLFGTKFESYLNQLARSKLGTSKTAGNWELLKRREAEGVYDEEPP